MLLLTIFFSFCESREPEYIYLNQRIVKSLVKEIASEYNLELYCSGGGFFTNVEKISLSFYCPYVLDVPSVEKMFVDISEKILNRYNTDLSIRPYLSSFPFTGSQIELGLRFPRNKNEGSIESIHRYGNTVLYHIVNLDGSTKREKETYTQLYNSVYGNNECSRNDEIHFQ